MCVLGRLVKVFFRFLGDDVVDRGGELGRNDDC